LRSARHVATPPADAAAAALTRIHAAAPPLTPRELRRRCSVSRAARGQRHDFRTFKITIRAGIIDFADAFADAMPLMPLLFSIPLLLPLSLIIISALFSMATIISPTPPRRRRHFACRLFFVRLFIAIISIFLRRYFHAISRRHAIIFHAIFISRHCRHADIFTPLSFASAAFRVFAAVRRYFLLPFSFMPPRASRRFFISLIFTPPPPLMIDFHY
jgi:hypothetical protein